jgi:isocitrate dehydrogenase
MSTSFAHVTVPADGEPIRMTDSGLQVPDQPIVPFIEGDGTGPDIWRASAAVFDAAVDKAYGGKRRIAWMEVLAGQKAFDEFGTGCPMHAGRISRVSGRHQGPADHAGRRRHSLAQRGPAADSRSVHLPAPRPLFRPACPARSSIRKRPTWSSSARTPKTSTPASSSSTARRLQPVQAALRRAVPRAVQEDSLPRDRRHRHQARQPGGHQRLVKAAIQYAIDNGRESVTLVHKGNIMKFTEGAFRDWGYEVAVRALRGEPLDGGPWQTLSNRQSAIGKEIIIKDVIADAFLQQILTRPAEYDVIATMNLNGDYISDALAACVGGIGIAPGGNINYDTGHAIFEATHGTAPKYAGPGQGQPRQRDPLRRDDAAHMGWTEAADLIIKGMEGAIGAKTVTYDFERMMDGATLLKCSEFGDAVVKHMGSTTDVRAAGRSRGTAGCSAAHAPHAHPGEALHARWGVCRDSANHGAAHAILSTVRPQHTDRRCAAQRVPETQVVAARKLRCTRSSSSLATAARSLLVAGRLLLRVIGYLIANLRVGLLQFVVHPSDSSLDCVAVDMGNHR